MKLLTKLLNSPDGCTVDVMAHHLGKYIRRLVRELNKRKITISILP